MTIDNDIQDDAKKLVPKNPASLDKIDRQWHLGKVLGYCDGRQEERNKWKEREAQMLAEINSLRKMVKDIIK